MNGSLSVCCAVLLAGTGLAARGAQAQERVTLRESVAAALRQNPLLDSARAQRESALAEAERTRPRFAPDVQISGSQFVRGPVLTYPKGAFDTATVLPRARTRLMLSAEQTIYQYGAGRAPQRRTSALVEAAEADYERSELDIALEVQEAYFTALQAQAFEQVAREAVAMAREQLRITRVLIEGGMRAKADELAAEASLTDAEAALLRARNGGALARMNLNRLMGRPLGEEVALEPVDGLPSEPPPTEEALPEAMRRRPDAAALRARIDVAETSTRLAKTQRLPRVTAEAAYALQNRSAFVPTNEWQAGVTVSAPVFESQRVKSDVRQAQAGAEQARAGLEALEGGVALELEQARRAYQEAREQRRVAEANLAHAEEVRRATLLVYEAGRATFAEVEAARLSITRALAQREQATYDMWLAHARWQRAAGIIPGVRGEGEERPRIDGLTPDAPDPEAPKGEAPRPDGPKPEAKPEGKPETPGVEGK